MKDNISLITLLKILGLYLLIITIIIYVSDNSSNDYYTDEDTASGSGLMTMFFVYLIITIGLSYFCYTNELSREKTDNIKFINDLPLRYSGYTILEFQHIFNYELPIIENFILHLRGELKGTGLIQNLNKKLIEDIDNKLKRSEIRVFHIGEAEPTLLDNYVSFATYTSQKGKSQNVKWWILLRGFNSKDETLKFFAYSPFTFPFWIISYIKRKHDLINRLRKVESGFYNYLDLETTVRTLHETTINFLVDYLDKHGIDTSDLKVQKAQILNIDISGGKTTFGNVVQGARNIVTSKTKTKKGV